MKNIFNNTSIKKIIATSAIAVQVTVGTNFINESFVDKAFAEGGFYNAYNSSIFEEFTLNQIRPIQTLLQKTKCVLDSDNNLDIKPRVYSRDNLGGLQSFKAFNRIANQIDYASSPSLDGLYSGTATSTFAFGPNYNSDVTISVTLSDSSTGVINQITPDSFEYILIPNPTFDYATATYSASTGLGDILNGIIIYNTSISSRSAIPLNVNYNEVSSVIRSGSSPATEVGQNPLNGTLSNISNEYKYVPNNNYIGQDFFTLFGNDYYVSVLRPISPSGFEGGNMSLSPGISSYYGSSALSAIGTSRFYKSLISNIPFSGDYLYKLESPTTTLALPQLFSNGSSTSFFIDTMSSFYRDSVKNIVLNFAKQFTIIVEHDNKAPITLPIASSTYLTLNSTGTADILADYSDLEIDEFNMLYEISNDNFDTIYASTTKPITPPNRSTSTDATSFSNLPLGNYQLRTSAIENTGKSTCLTFPNEILNRIASSTSTIKNFTVSNTIIVAPATTTLTTTLSVIVPSTPSIAPSGSLIPIIPVAPTLSTVLVEVKPTTTLGITKEFLGLNPEDSDDLLPGETPAAYLIRMEKRRVLGKSGSRNLVNTGSNVTSSLYVGAILLSSAALLFVENRVRRNKGEVKD